MDWRFLSFVLISLPKCVEAVNVYFKDGGSTPPASTNLNVIKYKMKNKTDLREQMIFDARLIFKSVSFLEKLIKNKMMELEEAINNNYEEDAINLEKQLKNLVIKIGQEDKEIQNYLIKYKKELENEKKAILFNTKQKKQIHIRSFPKNKRRKS